MENRTLIQIAKLISTLFMPLYAPLWVFIGLFLFSYLSLLPWSYKLFVLILVYLFTILIPTSGISIFRTFKKWTHLELSHREHRHMPYIITLLSYATCLTIMTKLNTAMFFRGVVMAGLIAQIICITINAWWKVSTHMVGIGPFLPQKDTPLGGRTAAVEGVDGTRSSVLDVTLALISILRILSPKLLIPATTALGTADPKGRERGILSGANVIMPNLSPVNVRDKYLLYDGKICTGEEAAECIECLRRRIKSIGYEIVTDRGDHPDMMAHEFHEGGKRNV